MLTMCHIAQGEQYCICNNTAVH